MSNSTTTPHCASRGANATISLPVVSAAPRVRKSKTSRWRALSLVVVHLLIIGHVVQWLITGRTVSPVEPSEAMYALNEGHVNAGLIFLALALLATLVFGRFVCGWGCHVVAYQDLCAWLLKKAGIKPKPFRSRLLVLAPLSLAFYMFFWPTVYRWFAGAPAPPLSNHLMTTEFWKTFPGLGVAVLTVAVCGFVIVYFLGAKGFCTYACPYGGLFGVADKVAPGRILVTDDCEHCGHCTATCTSNVRVHEEVAKYGMVVDPGCMKCMDCVSVCPNDALYFGFTAPPFLNQGTKARRHDGIGTATVRERAAKSTPFDFTLSEELLVAAVGLGSLLAYRGLYGQIPLLLAMGMAAITGFVAVKCLHMVRGANVRLQNLQFKRGGRVTRSGVVFVCLAVVLFAFTAHSAAVQANSWSGRRLFASLNVGDEVWMPGNLWWDRATAQQRSRVDDAIARLSRADRWGWVSTPAVLQDMIWLHLAKGDLGAAETAVLRLIALTPDEPEPHRGLAGILRKTGRLADAEATYRTALEKDPQHLRARQDLASLLASQGRHDETIEQLRLIVSQQPQQPPTARYPLAMALLGRVGQPTQTPNDLPEAVEQLTRVVVERPTFAEAHYNLGVAVFMTGRPREALPHIQESIRLNPNDAQAKAFLEVVQREIERE